MPPTKRRYCVQRFVTKFGVACIKYTHNVYTRKVYYILFSTWNYSPLYYRIEIEDI